MRRSSLYLAWLAGYGSWERDEYAFDRDEDVELEPPLPPGLRTLTAPQRALADFLRLDNDLLTVATELSPPLEAVTDDPARLATWVTNLPAAEKDRILVQVVEDRAAAARMEMLRRFNDESATTIPDPPRRTVADLLDRASRRRGERQRQVAAQHAADEARRERSRALARERRLDELARTEDDAWTRIDALIATRKPADYDAAVAMLSDLRALAERDGRHEMFARRGTALRHEHARKPSLIERLDRAGIGGDRQA